MILDSRTSSSETPLADVDQKVLSAYKDKFQVLTRFDICLECIGGCGVAGAIYCLFLMIGIAWFSSALLVMLFAWPFLMILGFLAGAIAATLVSIVALPVNASLGWPLKPLWYSFVVGGLSGFAPYWFLLGNYRLKDVELLYIAAWGSVPAMVLGHVCAYWNTKKVVNNHNEQFGVVKHDTVQAGVLTSRFGIKHIMILTIWAAVAFSLISVLTPGYRMFLAKFYIVSQLAAGLIAIIVIWIVSCIGDYRKRNVAA